MQKSDTHEYKLFILFHSIPQARPFEWLPNEKLLIKSSTGVVNSLEILPLLR